MLVATKYMANPEHLKVLRQGVKAWNQWREKDPRITPDFSEADLGEADLRRADLRGADLSGAYLDGANLGGASLSRANLSRASLFVADLDAANLFVADLGGATLIGATLIGANLGEANLGGADLIRANLSRASLIQADLTKTVLSETLFCFTSLASVKGLPTCRHEAPSSLDYATLMASGPLPEIFLRGCGLSDDFIGYLPSFWSLPIQFYSCFISYSHADKAFARRLHDALQGRGIRCWLDEKQLLPGDHIHREVDEAVRLWDKVLLCCSEKSLTSWWVDKEISKALKKEERLWKERKKQVLAIIPLNLDGYMFDAQWQDWKKQHVTDRLAADFRGWETDNGKFEAQFERVVKALRADAGAREPPPNPKL